MLNIIIFFRVTVYIFSRRDVKEHVKINYSQVGQIEERVKPVPYLTHHVLLLLNVRGKMGYFKIIRRLLYIEMKPICHVKHLIRTDKPFSLQAHNECCS